MHFALSALVLPFVVGGYFANASVLDKRLTRSKCDQFTSTNCDGNGGDGPSNRISSNVNIGSGTCIDIDGRTHSIFLARGTGLVWRRRMSAYAQTGCPSTHRIESITDRDPAGPCVAIDAVLMGQPGADTSQGRIMSIKFESF